MDKVKKIKDYYRKNNPVVSWDTVVDDVTILITALDDKDREITELKNTVDDFKEYSKSDQEDLRGLREKLDRAKKEIEELTQKGISLMQYGFEKGVTIHDLRRELTKLRAVVECAEKLNPVDLQLCLASPGLYSIKDKQKFIDNAHKLQQAIAQVDKGEG